MKLVVTEAADADLEGIGRYTLDQWGHTQAIIYLRGLVERFDEITVNPNLTRPAAVGEGQYRKCSYNTHVIYATIGSDVLTIVRVLHERMDAARHLP